MYFRVIDESESKRFDNFIRDTPNGHIFQAFSWGEAKKPEWEPLRFVGEDEKGNIAAAATVLKRRIPLLRKSFFYLPRGPVLQNWKKEELFLEVMDFLGLLAKKHRAIFIKIDPCITENNIEAVKLLDDAGFVTVSEDYEFGGLQPRFTFRLNIEQDPQDLLGSFKHKLRYKINYAYKQGVQFHRPGLEGLDSFMSILSDTSLRGDFVIRDRSYYQRVYQCLERDNAAAITIGRYQGRVITASMTFSFGNKAWNMYSGHADEHRNIYAYQALIWEQIKWAKERGAKWFDFYGVPGHVGKEHPLYGIYHFKKSFGGDFVTFVGEKDLVLSRFYYFFWTRLFPLYRDILLRCTRMFRWCMAKITGKQKKAVI
ncbi:MAG: peptidoglycan bridge formation glycyltransferase FemA/FemB family protein [Firmicutes bacterium]|nr:peptidoglycan bridge formation glycyltransferase FemA/FemB family protein [Bacillota bacterium]